MDWIPNDREVFDADIRRHFGVTNVFRDLDRLLGHIFRWVIRITARKRNKYLFFQLLKKKISQNISINILGKKSLYYHNSILHIFEVGKNCILFWTNEVQGCVFLEEHVFKIVCKNADIIISLFLCKYQLNSKNLVSQTIGSHFLKIKSIISKRFSKNILITQAHSKTFYQQIIRFWLQKLVMKDTRIF